MKWIKSNDNEQLAEKVVDELNKNYIGPINYNIKSIGNRTTWKFKITIAEHDEEPSEPEPENFTKETLEDVFKNITNLEIKEISLRSETDRQGYDEYYVKDYSRKYKIITEKEKGEPQYSFDYLKSQGWEEEIDESNYHYRQTLTSPSGKIELAYSKRKKRNGTTSYIFKLSSGWKQIEFIRANLNNLDQKEYEICKKAIELENN